MCYARIYHRLAVLSPSPLPREGAGILVSNHTSGLDPLLIQSVCNRLIIWMVAEEYTRRPALKWLFRQIESIPVHRSGRDVVATREALRALEKGRILGVFPEGRIERSLELFPFQTGTALMALKTGVPVYPVYLDGSQRRKPMSHAFFKPQNARLAFGEPIRLGEKFSSKELDGATLAVQSAVQKLGMETHRRPPAGHLNPKS